MTAQTTDCIDREPPERPSVFFAECDGWEACLDFENAGKLAAYVREMQRWIEQTTLACQERKEK